MENQRRKTAKKVLEQHLYWLEGEIADLIALDNTGERKYRVDERIGMASLRDALKVGIECIGTCGQPGDTVDKQYIMEE